MRKVIGLILLLVTLVLMTCTKTNYDRTLVGFWVEDVSQLPVVVTLSGSEIGTIEDHHLSEPSCGECEVSIELINGVTYDVIMYGPTKTYEVDVSVPEDECKTVKYLR